MATYGGVATLLSSGATGVNTIGFRSTPDITNS
jgi:hypothetical protein